MQWQDVCNNQNLKDLPFKIELNVQGQILMTPVKVQHSVLQGRIIGLLYRHLNDGEALAECAIKTSAGTKVTDVAWASYDRLETISAEVECSVAPEICIEVLSDSNTKEEMIEKVNLYHAAGAEEIWLCDQNQIMIFYKGAENIPRSQLAPGFPRQL